MNEDAILAAHGDTSFRRDIRAYFLSELPHWGCPERLIRKAAAAWLAWIESPRSDAQRLFTIAHARLVSIRMFSEMQQ